MLACGSRVRQVSAASWIAAILRRASERFPRRPADSASVSFTANPFVSPVSSAADPWVSSAANRSCRRLRTPGLVRREFLVAASCHPRLSRTQLCELVSGQVLTHTCVSRLRGELCTARGVADDRPDPGGGGAPRRSHATTPAPLAGARPARPGTVHACPRQ